MESDRWVRDFRSKRDLNRLEENPILQKKLDFQSYDASPLFVRKDLAYAAPLLPSSASGPGGGG